MKKIVSLLAVFLLLAVPIAANAEEYTVQPMRYEAYAALTDPNEYYYEKLNSYGKAIYDALRKGVRNGQTSVSIVWPDPLEFTVTSTSTTSEGLGAAVSASPQMRAISQNVGANNQLAMDAFQCDHPELFMLDAGNCKMQTGYSARSQSGNTASVKVTLTYELAYKSNASSRYSTMCTKVRNAGLKKSSRLETLRAIHDYVANITTYSSASAGTYDASGVFCDGKGVCQSYAHAFKVLCDFYSIPCVLVSGTAYNSGGNAEAHMWNYVQMDDGKWYAVDVTWDDQSTIYYDYFLSGSSTLATHFSVAKFSDSHRPNGRLNANYGSFEFIYPTLNSQAYAAGGNTGTVATAAPTAKPTAASGGNTGTPKPGTATEKPADSVTTPNNGNATTDEPNRQPADSTPVTDGPAGNDTAPTAQNGGVENTAANGDSDGQDIQSGQNGQSSQNPQNGKDNQMDQKPTKSFSVIMIVAAAVLGGGLIIFIAIRSVGVKRRGRLEKVQEQNESDEPRE